MKLVQKHTWDTHYPVHCRKCLWTGSSQFVWGDDEGPFYCPYCRTSDPTDWDLDVYAMSDWHPSYWKERLRYIAWRTLSLITHPWRLVMKQIWDYKFFKWVEESEKESDKYEL